MNWELVYIISSIAILPVLIIAIIVSIRVTTVIAHYQKVKLDSNLTAKELVQQIATRENLSLRVETASEAMGDHYDPRDKTVRLTQEVINDNSLSALAIAAHECGHAIQDARNYAPLRVRNVVVHISNFSSRLLTPLIIISFIASLFVYTLDANWLQWLLLSFCIIYGLSALVNFITLPTEFDASRRGKKLLEEMHLVETSDEKHAVNEVLRAAANTYVVAFAMSLLYLLRYLAMFVMFTERDR